MTIDEVIKLSASLGWKWRKISLPSGGSLIRASSPLSVTFLSQCPITAAAWARTSISFPTGQVGMAGNTLGLSPDDISMLVAAADESYLGWVVEKDIKAVRVVRKKMEEALLEK